MDHEQLSRTLQASQADERTELGGRIVNPDETRAAVNRDIHPFDLPDSRLAVAGDWHINADWVEQIIPRIAAHDPSMQTVLHSGDFGIWPGPKGTAFLRTVDEVCAEHGIARVLVTPGNHENWSRLEDRFVSSPGRAVQFSDVVWVMPRGYRFTIAGARFLSFGGAASLDRHRRIEGETWWDGEMPTDADVDAAIAGGSADVTISHDMVNGGIPLLDHRILRHDGWPAHTLAMSAMSRNRVTRVWSKVKPLLLFHGHMHTAAASPPGSARVVSLGCDNNRGNVALLDLPDLTHRWLPE